MTKGWTVMIDRIRAIVEEADARVVDPGWLAGVIEETFGSQRVDLRELSAKSFEGYERGEIPVIVADTMASWMMGLPDGGAEREGAKLMARLAGRGSPCSMYNLAIAKFKGQGTAVDETGANELLKRIIHGDTRAYPGLRAVAIATLAESIRDGRGCRKEVPKAIAMFEEAAAQGSAVAAYNAALYFNGKDGEVTVKPDLEKAARLYEHAASEGMVEARTNLGVLHMGRLIKDADPIRGALLLRQSMAEGDMAAKEALETFLALAAESAEEKQGRDGTAGDMSNLDMAMKVAVMEEAQRRMAQVLKASNFRIEDCRSFEELWSLLRSELDEVQIRDAGLVGFDACIVMPAAIARWLRVRRPDLLRKKELRIALLGAHKMEFLSLFGMVPALCGAAHMKLSVDVVGPNAMGLISEWGLTDVKVEPTEAGSYAGKGDVIQGLDLAVAFHPGFEAHGEEWLVFDGGLEKLAAAGVEIMCASYAPEEFMMDAEFAAACGMQASECEENPLKYGRGEDEPGTDTWACWGLWKLTAAEIDVDVEERDRRLAALKSATHMGGALIKVDVEVGVNNGDLRKLGRRVLLRDDGVYAEYFVLIRGFAVKTSTGELVRIVGEELGGNVGTSVTSALMSCIPAESAKWADKAIWVDKVWRGKLEPWLESGRDGVSSVHAMVGGARSVADDVLIKIFKVRPGSRQMHELRQVLRER